MTEGNKRKRRKNRQWKGGRKLKIIGRGNLPSWSVPRHWSLILFSFRDETKHTFLLIERRWRRERKWRNSHGKLIKANNKAFGGNEITRYELINMNRGLPGRRRTWVDLSRWKRRRGREFKWRTGMKRHYWEYGLTLKNKECKTFATRR